VATVLLALSPALWFFGTTIEVHALFFGAVTFAALVTLLVPWRHPGLALALVALLFPVLYWAHESAFLLGPGWVLLVQYARARRGTRYSWPALLLQVGPVLLLALGLGIALASLARDGSVAAVVESTRVQLEVPGYQAALHGRSVLWNEWFLPLGLFVPLALSGSPLLRQEAWRLPSFAALLLVPLVFFSWWGVLEQGGYSLGSAGFLLVPVALLIGGWSRPRGVLALFLLAGQAAWARVRIESFDQGWVPAERVTQVRSALGDSGLLLSSVGLAPDIRIDLPGVEEFSLRHFVHSACLREHRLVPPQEIVASLAPHLLRLFERHERVALETGFHRLTVRDGPALSAFVPSLSAVEEFLREHYLTRELAHPYWGLLVLERPKGR
jgi:hypothetical protein